MLCRRLGHLRALVVELRHRVVDAVHDADVIVTTDPRMSAPAVEVLQFGGAVLDPNGPDGQYVPAPVSTTAWRITVAAEMLELEGLAHATLLTDPPPTGLRWSGANPPPEPAFATPAGHHRRRLPRRGDYPPLLRRNPVVGLSAHPRHRTLA